MPKIVVSPLAQADVDEIWDYIARDSIRNADRFVDRLRRTLAWVLRATTFDRACGGLAMPAT